ncbi:MAG: FtsX-like permease family protein, partial [Hyphomicrobiales bacterium]|nr:FtsX-like permease family protein [Hyphomicrobiales bacterium]
MKAIGAKRPQIAQMYLVTIGSLGIVSLFIAIPLGGLAAYGFTSFMAGLINFDLRGFRIPTESILVMVAVGIIVPILASLSPIIKGVSITVREAISDFGLGKGQFGTSKFDRLVSWVTGRVLKLTRPLQISLRNTIRRKARLIFTLITMILGGSIFIGILSVHASLLATLDSALDYFAYDVDVNFKQSYRIDEIQRVALQIPGVVEADSWIGSSGRRVRPDGDEGPNLQIIGTAADTNLIKPQLLEGRWLRSDDTNAIVLNTEVTKEEEDVAVGDIILLNIDGREREWRVVGLVQGILTGPLAYTNRPYFERELRQVGRAGSIQIIAAQTDPAFQAELARTVKAAFEETGFQVNSTGTIQDIRDRIEYQFNLIVVFLAVMAVLIALVGGLGLMGTMSINVLERTREIG